VRRYLDLEDAEADQMREGLVSLSVLEPSEGDEEKEERSFRMRTLTLLALLSIPAVADEVVLKSGRRIEFKSIEDTGETYTIVSPEGVRTIVKRAEVEGFAKTEPAVPLTGASVTFDRKAKTDTVDLLKSVEPENDAITGTWKFGPGGVLVGATGGEATARLQIRSVPASEEYNLTVVLERTDGDDNVGIAFPTPGGGSAMWHFDIDRGAYQGLLVPEGADGHKKLASVQGKQFAVGKPKTVVFMVRKSALVVQIDGKDVSTYRADWSKISPLPQCLPKQRGAFAIYALKSGVRISRATITTVGASAK
jgi:hypothetical protein